MNEQDKQLIINLGTRLKSSHPVTKDKDAECIINNEISSQPDATYLLTQAVLLQEQAIQTLKQQVEQLQNQPTNNQGGFFSNLFGNKQGTKNNVTATPVNASVQNSSFLSSALTTAAGVAGGMFLYEGINHLFSSSHASAGNFLNAGNNTVAPQANETFQGQDSLLNDGFGNGNDFISGSGDSLDSSGDSFDGGFGDGGDW